MLWQWLNQWRVRRLTGVPYEEIVSGPGPARTVAQRDGAEHFVMALADGLRDALAAADGHRLDEVDVPWSQTEEFWGQAEPTHLAVFLRSMSSLSRRASERGDKLYCWVCH